MAQKNGLSEDEMLEVLIAPIAAAGVLDYCGKYGSALMLAMDMKDGDGQKQWHPAVQKLLDAGAKPDIAGKCGGTCLAHAIADKHEAAAEKLIPLIAAAGVLDTFSVCLTQPHLWHVGDRVGGWPTCLFSAAADHVVLQR